MALQPCLPPTLPCATSRAFSSREAPRFRLRSVFIGTACLILIATEEEYGRGRCCSPKISLNSSCRPPQLHTQLWLLPQYLEVRDHCLLPALSRLLTTNYTKQTEP